ncbi:MAG: pyrroline-5-carboxylate reductase [bacterium]|nr:pyrroline-5-carboxylate reductase [bacterium]
MKIFLIGFGHMGQAIAQSLRGLPVRARTQTGSKSRHDIFVADRDAARVEKESSHLSVTPDNSYAGLKDASAVIIAIKPQDLVALAEEIRGRISGNSILVSVAAGVTIAKIKELFGHEKIVRVMPNIGLSVGQGISAWKSSGLSAEETVKARKLLNDLSENFEVDDEGQIDAVTAISGSGPAYFFAFAEALEKAAGALGLDEKESRALVEKTFAAAASLQEGAGYGELIQKVASKGGTTEAALRVFEKNGLSRIVEDAARAAYKRAQELNEK